MKNIFNNNYILIIIAIVIGIAVGWLIKPSVDQPISDSEHEHISTSETWTCSMHPQIRQSEPGQCPICGMDLIPVEAGDEDGIDPNAVSMSETAMKLANVRTSIVGNGQVEKTLDLTGKVMPDERLIVSQSSHIPGRVEQLNINFTGEFVNKGQVLARIYSPDLVTAQEELFVAQKYQESQPGLFKSAKEKLKNWKLSNNQIESILKSGKPIDQFPITADVTGYVVSKNVNLGDYVNRGQAIYKIADLSKVWVQFDIYESDLAWVSKGDAVSFTVPSLPAQTFESKITYLDPVIDPKTRVAKARVEVQNKTLNLKPEMFVKGELTTSMKSESNTIIIPKSAVMWTGKRSVVYVKTISDKGTSFLMREVELGPALGEAYVINDGLEVGEEIATNGTFSIDAAAQLAGKPSMMSPEGGAKMTGHNHGEVSQNVDEPTISETYDNVNEEFKSQLKAVYQAYLPVKDALVSGNETQAQQYAKTLKSKLSSVNMSLVKGDAHNTWMQLLSPMQQAVEQMISTSLEKQRAALIPLTDGLFKSIKTYKISGLDGYYQYCPMANNYKGAYWLSAENDVKNPYFGDAMLTCGEVVEEID